MRGVQLNYGLLVSRVSRPDNDDEPAAGCDGAGELEGGGGARGAAGMSGADNGRRWWAPTFRARAVRDIAEGEEVNGCYCHATECTVRCARIKSVV